MFVKLKKMFLFYMGEGMERVRRQVERMQGWLRSGKLM